MHAAELGIRLQVSTDSTCRDHDLLIPVDGFATILGNLMENAIEELSHDHTASPDVIQRHLESPRAIHIGIYCRPDVNIITCEDTGRGIQPQLLDHIFEKGVSSKGENRGTGLFLVHELMGGVRRNHRYRHRAWRGHLLHPDIYPKGDRI